MRYALAPIAIIFLAWQAPYAQAGDCSRVVSLAPSITETLFEIGLGDRIVGVTRFDTYPDQVSSIQRIGGLLDPDLETMLLLKPSLVVGLEEHAELAGRLRSLGLKVLLVEHSSISGIVAAVEVLGQECSRTEAAHVLAGRLRAAVARHRAAAAGRPALRVMILVGSSGSASLRDFFISGRDGFYSELLEILGAENVFKRATGSLAGVSAEGMIALNPDILVVINSDPKRRSADEEKIKAIFSDLAGVAAVKNNRIYLLNQDYASVPGPRFVRLLDDLKMTMQ